MKELLNLLKNKRFKELFYAPTQNGVLQFFRYMFAGGGATVADWLTLFVLFDLLSVELYFAVAVAFSIGLIVNFWLSNLFVFNGAYHRASKTAEFTVYILSGLIGLAFTEILMYVFCTRIGWHYIPSKVITTVIVLAWNFGSKKILLYRKKRDK